MNKLEISYRWTMPWSRPWDLKKEQLANSVGARTSFPINWILISKTTEKNELSWMGVIQVTLKAAEASRREAETE